MDLDAIKRFCDNWLASWTGNRPEVLIDYYSEDAYYQDPANPEGLRGREHILSYFKKLLAVNPEWAWKAVEIILTSKGFVLKWQASIPLGSKTITETGLDIVEIIDDKITRNEVFFDRSQLLAAIADLKKGKK